jgi:hypothetical protein
MNGKILSIAAALGLLIGTTALGYAQSPRQDSAPGQRTQGQGNRSGSPGATGAAPGQQLEDRGGMDSPGASGAAPGQPPASTGQGSRGGPAGSKNTNPSTGGGMNR